MSTKIKSIALVITLAFGLSFSVALAATWSTSTSSTWAVVTTWEQFAMKDVVVVDSKTLKISFTKDLFQDPSVFEFLLTSKKNETKEITLTGTIFTSSNELQVNTNENLVANEEYNLVVIYASDKDWKIIENWVDGMITFKIPENVLSSSWTVNTVNTTTNTTNTTNTAESLPDMNSAPIQTVAVPDTNVQPPQQAVDANWDQVAPTEEVAASANTLPQTWTTESLIIVLAMLLGLWAMYLRKKA